MVNVDAQGGSGGGLPLAKSFIGATGAMGLGIYWEELAEFIAAGVIGALGIGWTATFSTLSGGFIDLVSGLYGWLARLFATLLGWGPATLRGSARGAVSGLDQFGLLAVVVGFAVVLLVVALLSFGRDFLG